MPCSVAIESSSLRATSVSICAGLAPGSAAVTVIMGRSMSGNCWIFMPRKPIAPTSVSSTNSSTAGIGLRIDQAETFIAGTSPLRRGGRGLADDPHEITVAQEADAARDDPRVGGEALDDFDAVAHAAADADLGLRDAPVRLDAERPGK